MRVSSTSKIPDKPIIAKATNASGRWVISLRRTDSSDVLEIIRLTLESAMYNQGLERNYKKLVDMESIADSLAILVQSYINIGYLTEENWDNIQTVYVYFVDQHLTFERVNSFVAGEEEWK